MMLMFLYHYTKVIEAEIDIEIIEQTITNLSYQKSKSKTKLLD